MFDQNFGRYALFQMAEVAIPRRVFATILTMINALRGPQRSLSPNYSPMRRY